MKKDIQIPQVEGVYIAVKYENNEWYRTRDWNAYIINDKAVDLDRVIIVSCGYSKDKITSVFRKHINVLPWKSYAKIEFMQEEFFTLNNSFKVSFFVGDKLFDKTYLFKRNTITLDALQPVPLMQSKGIVVK
ncbi:hypothetical protein [Aestuariivivens sediminis]|uniref:hypothetical protein n=1 Tax=Aestuariivivens sediminis TaxID=2913557 RepID=UPI001F55D871|nr:hypothetical protein [Aestuariivivens sediminis]